MELGLNFVKFFPAEQAGGLAYIKAVSAPYSQMVFMPTGGVNENNLNAYLQNPKIVCCGGSWICPDKLVKAGDWQGITELCKSAVSKMLDFRLAHVGINAAGQEEALLIAGLFESAFGFAKKEGNSSVFAGALVEVMKGEGRGKNGHIAISTPNVKRAVFQLGLKNIEVDYSTAKYDQNGKLTVIYLKNEFGGFGVHLVRAK